MKKKLVVLTGAGMSAESGIKTFRDSGGLWEEYDVMQVASIEGWFQDPELVQRFYNERRLQLKNCQPNQGHVGIAQMEQWFDVSIITQNIDNLHERAGSSSVLHLHGELTKAKSSTNDNIVVDVGYSEVNMGDKASDGGQLRPNIVWFGEAVPAMEEAIRTTRAADIFVIIGTSLNIYPAASLVHHVNDGVPVYLIDPHEVKSPRVTHHIMKGAGEGVKVLMNTLETIVV